MAKVADKYFIEDPWKVIEIGFNPEYSEVSESIFSLGNEYMGMRGYFEEGYSGKTLIGSYFNGVYEQRKTIGSHYKGIIDKTEFMVNSVDWLYTKIQVGSEVLDLNTSTVKEFKRVLDMKTGLLTRSFVWVLSDNKEVAFEFERFLSMKTSDVGCQKITMTAINFDGEITVTSGLDFSNPHFMFNTNFWTSEVKVKNDVVLSTEGTTTNIGHKVRSTCSIKCNAKSVESTEEVNKVYNTYKINLNKGNKEEFVKIVINEVSRAKYPTVLGENTVEQFTKLDYNTLLNETIAWWDMMWNESDIVIEGDDLNQQGIRFCIFQMHQTYHGANEGNNIGAKGLTGEAYSGNSFWDTETYCLPFYVFNNVEASKHLLKFRYITLNEAKERAKALDLKGAFYPIATISGHECCDLWQHASLQLQASTAVSYGFWHYEKITSDREFIYEFGLPVLVEVSRMLASRGDWSADRTHYGYYGVMGPDEFQLMCNNNCYTNYMGKFSLDYAIETLQNLKNENIELYEKSFNELGLSEAEINAWSEMSEKMYILYDKDTKLFEQQEGFFSLPHIDIDEIPVEDFPLYHNWSYDRIYRNDMIKQPDVLMFMLLLNSSFTDEEVKANYDYYEPRCIHESSLSPSVHSILAAQARKHEEAYDLFSFATRLDLDNYNRNTREGLHTTSISAGWMNILYGFGGMRSDREGLSFRPAIPKKWDSYSFRLTYNNVVIIVNVGKEVVEFSTLNNGVVDIEVYGEKVTVNGEKTVIEIPLEWRA